MHVILFDVHL